VYRTATTTYPCCLPTLGEFSGSWSYTTYPMQRYKKSERIKAKRQEVLNTFKNADLFTGCQQNTYGNAASFFTFQKYLSANPAGRGCNGYGQDAVGREICVGIENNRPFGTYAGREGGILLVVSTKYLPVVQTNGRSNPELRIGGIGATGRFDGLFKKFNILRSKLVFCGFCIINGKGASVHKAWRFIESKYKNLYYICIMLNPCLYKAFCFVFCLFPLSVSTWAFPLPDEREQKISREQYIDTYKGIAVAQMHRYGIPASIILAQGCLESGNGNSRLAREANNHFGIKCHDWEGDRIYHDDDALQECFRKYRTAEDSYYDHSEFLRTRPRYANLFLLERTDYTSWANGLKEAGYATNPSYARLLIELIEQYGLHQYDLLAPQDTIGKHIPEVQPWVPSYDFTGEDVFSIDVERRILKTNGKRYVLSAPGDTYSSLAAEFRLFRRELTRYNDVAADAGLATGEKVYLERKAGRGKRGEASWSSAPGESLADISQRFGIRLQSLRKLNPGVADFPAAGTIVRLR